MSGMRIISGKHKGRRIDAGKAAPHVRPTSGFAREAIFNIIGHGAYSGANSPYRDKAVADMCCGTGAFGLEALSRGAAHVTFVDMDHHALLATRGNAERMNERETTTYIRADVANLPQAKMPYSLIFLDPPYFSGLIAPCLKSLIAGKWVDEESLVIVEHDARETLRVPPEFAEIDLRHYGRATVRLLKLAGKE